MSLDTEIDLYFATKKKIHQAFSYRPDWVEIPMEDDRDRYWMLVGGEGRSGTVVFSNEPLTKDSIEGGMAISSASIYTQRFLKTWVYRNGSHVMVCADTHTDGNKFLMIFDASKECCDEELREAYASRWGEMWRD